MNKTQCSSNIKLCQQLTGPLSSLQSHRMPGETRVRSAGIPFLGSKAVIFTDMNNQGAHIKNPAEKCIKCYVHFQCERDLETIKPE